MMHDKKLFTSYFNGVLRCNRISNPYSGFIKLIQNTNLNTFKCSIIIIENKWFRFIQSIFIVILSGAI